MGLTCSPILAIVPAPRLKVAVKGLISLWSVIWGREFSGDFQAPKLSKLLRIVVVGGGSFCDLRSVVECEGSSCVENGSGSILAVVAEAAAASRGE